MPWGRFDRWREHDSFSPTIVGAGRSFLLQGRFDRRREHCSLHLQLLVKIVLSCRKWKENHRAGWLGGGNIAGYTNNCWCKALPAPWGRSRRIWDNRKEKRTLEKKFIVEERELIDYIESLGFEVEARRALIEAMLRQGRTSPGRASGSTTTSTGSSLCSSRRRKRNSSRNLCCPGQRKGF